MPNFDKDTGKYLTAEDVATGDIIKFTDAGIEVEKEFKGKKSKKIEIGVALPDGTEKVATLNPTSRNLLIEHLGSNSDNWVGKEARIDIVRALIQGESKKVVYVCPPNMDFEGNIVQSR